MQVDFLEANPAYGLVHTDYNIFYESENKIERNYFQRDEGDIFQKLIIYNQLGALTAMYRGELGAKAIDSGIYEQGFLMEDYPLWLYMALHSKIGYIHEVTAVWRKLNESISNSLSLQKKLIFESSVYQVQAYFLKHSTEYPATVQSLVKKHKRQLLLAYIHQLHTVGELSFSFLKKHKALSLTDIKNYSGIKLPQVFKLFKSIKSTFSASQSG